MTPTNHFAQRMNQRGHTKAMIELALLCGSYRVTNVLLTRRTLKSLLIRQIDELKN